MRMMMGCQMAMIMECGVCKQKVGGEDRFNGAVWPPERRPWILIDLGFCPACDQVYVFPDLKELYIEWKGKTP